MTYELGYRCSQCGREDPITDPIYTCSHDGGNLDVVFDYAAMRESITIASIEASEEHSIWRYLPLLPVGDPGHVGTPLRSVGWTPLYAPPSLRRALGLSRLWVKDDGRNPTASFKDRASAVVVARAQEIGAEQVVTASTGNAGAALAGMAAAAQVPATIFAPKTAPPAKVAQLMIYGATVFLVDGTYDQAFDLSIQASETFGWYCRNTGYNPFTAEGKKTAAFEICEQWTAALDEQGADGWRAPEAVFVSVGDGNIISGLHKGFKDLKALGWIDSIPRLYGVQATGSAAIYDAYAAGTERIEPVTADTLADSISVDLPRDGLRALRAATETGGAYLAVSDDAILQAMSQLAVQAGVFAEPAGAAAFAGLLQALDDGVVRPDDAILLLNTGNGIKDVASAMRATGEPTVIEPTMEALSAAMEGVGGGR
jgi:threonine synthase